MLFSNFLSAHAEYLHVFEGLFCCCFNGLRIYYIAEANNVFSSRTHWYFCFMLCDGCATFPKVNIPSLFSLSHNARQIIVTCLLLQRMF